jgi:hypothetical protein
VVVAGFLVAAGLSSLVVMWLAGRDYAVNRDPSVDLAEIGGRHVGILGGLAGFAVTAMVLLVTLGRDLPDASGAAFTTLLTMFFVAYMGFVATSLMFATITDRQATEGFDVAAASFVSASITLSFSITIGWLALRPVFQAFGLERMAELAGWLLVAAVIAGYGQLAKYLHRAGYVDLRMAVLVGAVATIAAVGYAASAALLGLVSPDSLLILTVVGFVVGTPAYVLIGFLPLLSGHPRFENALTRFGPHMFLAFIQTATVLLGFLVLTAVGLA